jgi:hypothetical protein
MVSHNLRSGISMMLDLYLQGTLNYKRMNYELLNSVLQTILKETIDHLNE